MNAFIDQTLDRRFPLADLKHNFFHGEMPMFIDGFGLAGYRSFGASLQRFGPCAKVNVFIGQNNSGKSNVLNYLKYRYETVVTSAGVKSSRWQSGDYLDRHLGGSAMFGASFGLDLTGSRYQHLRETWHNNHPNVVDMIEKLLRSNTLTHGGSVAWFDYRQNPGDASELTIDQVLVDSLIEEQIFRDNQWEYLLRGLGGQRGNLAGWIAFILQQISPVVGMKLPPVQLIPAIRQVNPADENSEDLSGAGLVNKLARLQNPSLTEREAAQRFREISRFLKDVVGNESARIEIPHDRSTIYVEMDGRLLPLERLGTGIHQVVILAAAATVLKNQILCIEEPEIHLHPGLQRKLLKFLQEHTENQYFITTHSAHLLDAPGTSVFHIRHEEGASQVDAVYTSTQRAAVCADLGYRASDLLQANAVIWVEGPSDRIYIRHWLQAVAPNFLEGLHYSIMFYGGRLLNHLSANDPDVVEFISLRRLNRYISIVIDSDRNSPEATINATKQRIRREFQSGPGFAWVTRGREIENYVPVKLLEQAVRATHPRAMGLVGTGPFERPLIFRTRSGKVVSEVDKVKIAHYVSSLASELDVLDLRRQIERLSRFVANANGL